MDVDDEVDASVSAITCEDDADDVSDGGVTCGLCDPRRVSYASSDRNRAGVVSAPLPGDRTDSKFSLSKCRTGGAMNSAESSSSSLGSMYRDGAREGPAIGSEPSYRRCDGPAASMDHEDMLDAVAAIEACTCYCC